MNKKSDSLNLLENVDHQMMEQLACLLCNLKKKRLFL
jgi:hypothetical protein